MSETKKCKKCQSDIPLEYINCPNCPSFINKFGLIFFLLAVVFIIFTAVNSGNGNNNQDKNNSSEVRIGEASVYEEISQTTNCQELQERFDLTYSHWERNSSNGKHQLAKISTEYMKAIDEQMERVGCY